jgi:hypothetical protein
MRKQYCCEASQHLFDQYYSQQQKGGGDFPVYVGRARQRGHGLGDIFKSIWRILFPAMKSLAPHALRAGANIVEDVTKGKTWKDSTLKHVLGEIPGAISSVTSSRNVQSGSGVRRKQNNKRKRVRRDIFS